eukprot:SAG11_NODE_3616_length_2337_cov_1.323503_1_plen_40_part_10
MVLDPPTFAQFLVGTHQWLPICILELHRTFQHFPYVFTI